jgi:hypothetical protein
MTLLSTNHICLCKSSCPLVLYLVDVAVDVNNLPARNINWVDRSLTNLVVISTRCLFLDRLGYYHRRVHIYTPELSRYYMSSPELLAVTESITNLSIVTTHASPPQEGEGQRSEETLTPRQAHYPPDGEQLPETTPERLSSSKAEKQSPSSGSDTETEATGQGSINMPSGSSSKHQHHHHSSSSSSKRHGSSSSSKHQSKGDDWSEVTEPEERRRIQNRIAQRKFRKYLIPKATTLCQQQENPLHLLVASSPPPPKKNGKTLANFLTQQAKRHASKRSARSASPAMSNWLAARTRCRFPRTSCPRKAGSMATTCQVFRGAASASITWWRWATRARAGGGVAGEGCRTSSSSSSSSTLTTARSTTRRSMMRSFPAGTAAERATAAGILTPCLPRAHHPRTCRSIRARVMTTSQGTTAAPRGRGTRSCGRGGGFCPREWTGNRRW